jgi:O-antigen/teichoic acid export membrane protein
MNRSKFLLRSVLAAGDQAVVSIGNLAIGLAFVKFAPKAEYGQYSMIFAGLLLGQSLQNAAFLSPMLTVLPGLSPAERNAALRRLGLMQASFAVALATLAGIAYALFSQFAAVTPVPAMAVSAAVIGVLAREAVRGTQYAAQRVVGAFAGSLLYSFLMIGGIALLISQQHFNLFNVLLMTFAAGIASTAVLVVDRSLNVSSDAAPCPDDLGRRIWECARWALPSVVVSWAASFAYVYPLGALVGAAAVADVSAARLFLVPVSLLVTGWANVFRPRASRLLADRKVSELESMAHRSAALLVCITVGLGLVVTLLLPTFERHFAAQYAGLMPIVIAWTIYFCVQTVRGVGMSAMLASQSGYKPLHTYGWISLAATAPAVLAACMATSSPAVVSALTVGELVLLTLIGTRGWPEIKATVARQEKESND